ncbi:MAG: PAS domain-containing protein [Candidatus Hydrothermarchaeales archaeon]
MVIDHVKKHHWGFAIGIIGPLVVGGYLIFEYLIYQRFLDFKDVIEHPLEHFIIFSIAPLSAALGFAVDRKIQAEREMHQHRHHAETIINHIGEGVVELDQDFKILSTNDFVLKLMKGTKEEIIGEKCYELFHRRQEACPDCPVKVTFDTGKSAYTAHEGIAKDGSKTYVELNSYPIKEPSGRVIRVIETVKDILERKKHEEEMAEKRHLEKISRAAIGRELKMVELKKRIKKLEDRIKELESKEK